MERISFEFKGISLFVAMERNEVVRIGRTDEVFMDRSPLCFGHKRKSSAIFLREDKDRPPFPAFGDAFSAESVRGDLIHSLRERRSYSDVSAMLLWKRKSLQGNRHGPEGQSAFFPRPLPSHRLR